MLETVRTGGLPEEAQNKDGEDEGCQRHGVADGVSDPHSAQEFTMRGILHIAHTLITIYIYLIYGYNTTRYASVSKG